MLLPLHSAAGLMHRTFLMNREAAVDYLNTVDRVYVVDGYANWDPQVWCTAICWRLEHSTVCTAAPASNTARTLSDCTAAVDALHCQESRLLGGRCCCCLILATVPDEDSCDLQPGASCIVRPQHDDQTKSARATGIWRARLCDLECRGLLCKQGEAG